MADLKEWLLNIRQSSQRIGDVAFRHTEQKRDEWQQLSQNHPIVSTAAFNSALEQVYNEQDDCVLPLLHANVVDPLNFDQISIEFQPLYEAIHIYNCLEKTDDLRDTYDSDRRGQMNLLLPPEVKLDDDGQFLRNLLANVTGFALIERATSVRTHNFRLVSDIEALWELMCSRVIDLVAEAVGKLTEPRLMLAVKDAMTLFSQTIQVLSVPI